MNIIDSCCRFTGVDRVAAFVGGLHFVDGEEAETEVRTFIRQWKERYPEMRVYTGHCTGTIAKEVLAETDGAVCFYTGKLITPL